MKKENLKKEYEIKKMNQKEFENFKKENESLIYSFEDDENSFMIRKNKKNLYIIQISEKKERNHLDRDIKIDSKKINDIGIKLIYHRDKNSEKEYRIFISYKDENKKLIRKRLRNKKIDSISRDEEKMISYYQNLTLEEIKEKIS